MISIKFLFPYLTTSTLSPLSRSIFFRVLLVLISILFMFSSNSSCCFIREARSLLAFLSRLPMVLLACLKSPSWESVYLVAIFSNRYLDSDRIHFKTFISIPGCLLVHLKNHHTTQASKFNVVVTDCHHELFVT